MITWFLSRTGEGVVEFGSRGDMEYALDKLDGAELGGRRSGQDVGVVLFCVQDQTV